MTPEVDGVVEVLQKLLLPWQADDVLHNGSAQLGGAVVRAGEAALLGGPTGMLAAYGIDADRAPDATHVDVLRFALEPLMSLSRPPAVEAPWPTYPTGFLHAPALVPVWFLARTRCPRGTELWRIFDSGEQQLVSVFDGVARGWRGAQRYVPPSTLVGMRATWEGVEYAAELTGNPDGEVELAAVGERSLEGFETVRPLVSVRRVPLAECDLFERHVTATWRSLECRLLDQGATTARILVEHPSSDRTDLPGLGEVEPGIFEATVPLAELASVTGRTIHIQPGRP